MITEKVQNLFFFIDYLHSNIEYYESKQSLIDEVFELKEQRDNLKKSNNYKDKIKCREIENVFAEKVELVKIEVANPIKEKIKQLEIATDDNLFDIKATNDLFDLQNNFEENDLERFFSIKDKYLEFRKISDDFWEIGIGSFLFREIDKAFFEFYNFFKDKDKTNDFEFLKPEVIEVQTIKEAVKILATNSKKLHFETFPEFLDYLKKEVKDLDFDERHSEVKRLIKQKRIILENSTFQSEIDEVKIFSENAVKDFKHKLMLSFTNENYKTKTIGFMPTNYNYVIGLIEYEKLYNSAKNKSDIFNYLSTLSKEEIEEKIQNAQTLKRLCEISIDYSKDGSWSVGNLPIEFESITKVDLFVENFIKSIEILAKEGKDVHQLIDLFIQTVKTNLENPLMEKNAKTNRHLFNRLEGVKLLLLNVKVLPPQQKQIQHEAKTFEEQELENNFTLSTIEDWLFEFKDKMTKTDYQTLVSALSHYFDNGSFPIISKPIQINGRINKKLFGWALNRIFEAKGKSVEKELLQFAKQNISLFIDVNFDENNIRKSNLYKYFTTKTQ